MALRATKSDENGRELRYFGRWRGVAEVVSALEKLRPLGSLIRIALLNQSMRVAFPRGRAIARNGAYSMLSRVLPLPRQKG
jgi:hypothetical protein